MSRVSKKAPKDVNAPKKPLSSFFLFTNERRPQIKASQPDIKTTEIGKLLGAEWKSLDATKKQKYTEQATAAKAEYAVKFAEYQKTTNFTAHAQKLAEWKQQRALAPADAKSNTFKATKKPKDDKAPKRPQTAYFLFAASVRPKLTAAHPDKKVTGIAKLIGAEWKALSETDKAPFVADAKAAKAAYVAQLAAYEGSEAHKAFAARLSAWKQSEKANKAVAAGKAPKVSLPRKPKDTQAPKRPQTAYFAFTAARRAEVSAANPDKKITEIAKLLGAEWKTLSEADKAGYAEVAKASKAAYLVKMAAYEGSEAQKAYAAQLAEWEAECARRTQKALAKMDLEVVKGKTPKGKGKAKGVKATGKSKKFVDSESDESESTSYESSSGSDEDSDSDSSSEESSSYSE